MSVITPQPILTPEEKQTNEIHKSELFSLVASGQSLLFVGAGCSAIVGYDTWRSLLSKLKTLACSCGSGFVIDNEKRDKYPLEYADDIKAHISNSTGDLNLYKAEIYKLFSPKEPPFNEFHRTLMELPFRGIITTNYDKVLEAVLSEQIHASGYDNDLVISPQRTPGRRISEFLLSLVDNNKYPKRIAHIHGRYDDPDSIVLSLSDYEKAYGFRTSEYEGALKPPSPEWSMHRKLLWAILATRRVVFIGFSMDDPYLRKMLNDVSRDLWNWNESTHFAVMGISPENADWSKIKAQSLKTESGIDVVFYEHTDTEEPHYGLVNIVNEMAAQCTISVTPTISKEGEKPDELKVMRVSQPRRKKRANDSFPSWMRTINKRMEARMNSHED